MKRVVVLLVLCAFVFSFSVSQSQAATKITLWTLFTGGEGYIMTDLVKKFNAEHPDIVVEEQIVAWGEYYNKLLTSLLAGEAPDVGIMHLAVLPDYASRGVLNPIDAALPAGFADKFLKNILSQAKYDGKQFAIPIDTHPMVMYYNKKALKAAGLVDAKGEVLVPKTWAELLDYSKKFKEKTGKWGLTLETGPMLGERWWIAAYSQVGASFLNPKTGKLEVDLDKATKAYDLIAQFYKAGVAPVPMNYNDAESLFINGENAYHFNGVWAMAVYPTTEGLEFGVTSLPALEGSKPFTWGDSHSLVFPKGKDDAKFKAALTFGVWFSEHTMEWAKAGHLPVNGDVMKSEAFLNLPMRKDYVGVGETAVLAPSVKGWTQIRQAMWDNGEKTLLGQQTTAQAAEALKKKIEEIGAAQ
jgi:multiple sugar transport system substrate-binding protein